MVGVEIWACRVICPAYKVVIGLEPCSVTGTGLEEGCPEDPKQQLFGLVHWRRGGGGEGCLRPDSLSNHPSSKKASGHGETLYQGAPDDDIGGVGFVTFESKASDVPY